MRKIILILLSLFSMASYAYDACQAYHPYNNPNPSVPCSYNGYDYDSLAVEAGVNSFFYKGQNYTLTDYDWWWSLLSQPYETCDGLMVAWGSYNCSHNLSFSKSGALFFGPGASYAAWQLTINIAPQNGGTVASSPASDFSCSNGVCEGGFSGNITLTATPAENCMFAYWNDGTITSGDNPLTVNMSGDKTLDAVFICSLQWPLTGSMGSRTILSGFGDNWPYGECPTGTDKLHAGLDVDASINEAVYGAYDGVVKAIFTDQHSTWADAIVLEHDISGNKFTTVYWHVAAYGGLEVNDSVTKGDQVATVANLGSNTHFHFGIRLGAYHVANSLAGSLPTTSCGGYPAFSEHFIDPETIPYE